MICFPNAKINLGLNIVSKRPDGYHNIETIFYPVDIRDALEVTDARGEEGIFRQTGIPVDGNPSDNLVMKAYRLLSGKYMLPEVDIHLLKKIPFGAGLGGGSADAACMLKLMNDFAGLHISEDELESLAALIGADCAFFIRNKPVFASGIGNLFENIDCSLKGYHLLIVKPDIHISTKEAYAMVKPRHPEISLKSIIRMPIENWKEAMVNDFESGIFAQYPAIQTLKNGLYEMGAVYASMSGSGSSVYGIFRSPADLPETLKFSDSYWSVL